MAVVDLFSPSERGDVEGLNAYSRTVSGVAEALIPSVASLRVGEANYQVTGEARHRLSTRLASRWVSGYSRQRREKTMSGRRAGELLYASNGIGASIKRKDDLQKMAESNKSFAHYRW